MQLFGYVVREACNERGIAPPVGSDPSVTFYGALSSGGAPFVGNSSQIGDARIAMSENSKRANDKRREIKADRDDTTTMTLACGHCMKTR